MKPKLDLSEFVINDYILISALPTTSDISVKSFKGTTYTEVDETLYDLVSAGPATIIAFKQLSPYFSPFTVYVEYDSVRQALELTDYARVQELFGTVPYKNSYVYWLLDSVVIGEVYTKNTYSAIPAKNRCDVIEPTYGPWRFEVRDGIKNSLYDTVVLPQSAWADAVMIISEPGCGHIVRLTMTGDVESLKHWPSATVTADTLIESVQLLKHWSLLNSEPWNSTERVSVMSKKFTDELSLSNELNNEIDEMCPETAISKFIMNQESAREHIDSPIIVGDKLNSYLKTRLCYSSLSALVKHSPVNVEIPEEILNNDLTVLELKLYKYFVDNNLEYGNKTEYELLTEVQTKIDSGNYHVTDKKFEKLLLELIAARN